MIRTLRHSRKLRTLIARTYDQKVINYFENPPNVGTLDKNAPNVGTCKESFSYIFEIANFNFSDCGFHGLWRLSQVPS